jgi:hypothetical protein
LDESCISNPKSEIANWTLSDAKSNLRCRIRPISYFPHGRSSDTPLPLNFGDERPRLGRIRKDLQHVTDLAQGLAEEIRIKVGLHDVQPGRQILTARAASEPLIAPYIFVAPKSRRRHETVKFRRRLVQPPLDTLRKPGRLRQQLTCLLRVSLFFVRSAKQE